MFSVACSAVFTARVKVCDLVRGAKSCESERQHKAGGIRRGPGTRFRDAASPPEAGRALDSAGRRRAGAYGNVCTLMPVGSCGENVLGRMYFASPAFCMTSFAACDSRSPRSAGAAGLCGRSGAAVPDKRRDTVRAVWGRAGASPPVFRGDKPRECARLWRLGLGAWPMEALKSGRMGGASGPASAARAAKGPGLGGHGRPRGLSSAPACSPVAAVAAAGDSSPAERRRDGRGPRTGSGPGFAGPGGLAEVGGGRGRGMVGDRSMAVGVDVP